MGELAAAAPTDRMPPRPAADNDGMKTTSKKNNIRCHPIAGAVPYAGPKAVFYLLKKNNVRALFHDRHKAWSLSLLIP